MSKAIRMLFFAIGLAAILIMVFSFDLTWSELSSYVGKSGWFFPLAIILWCGVYILNTWSWKIILKGLGGFKGSFLKLYKFTISGFALNYVTPGGLNGGEPYRILELRQYVGTAKAVSSTILYSIAHIGSHLVFWMIGAILVCLYYPKYTIFGLIVVFLGAFLLFLFVFIMQKGVMNILMVVFTKIPYFGKKVAKYVSMHMESITQIDNQVRLIYTDHIDLFVKTILVELSARLLGCVEVLLIPVLFHITFVEAYLVIAISSLLGNLLFFMPMQLGGREGGFVLAFSILGIPMDLGLFVALLFRIRELILIVLGVGLIQLGDLKSRKSHL